MSPVLHQPPIVYFTAVVILATIAELLVDWRFHWTGHSVIKKMLRALLIFSTIVLLIIAQIGREQFSAYKAAHEPRHLTDDQKAAIANFLRPDAGSSVTVEVQQDPGAIAFSNELVDALTRAGWNVDSVSVDMISGLTDPMDVYANDAPAQLKLFVDAMNSVATPVATPKTPTPQGRLGELLIEVGPNPLPSD